MKAKLLMPMKGSPAVPAYREYLNKHGRLPALPAGHVIDNSDAYLLVRMGFAEPADEECEKAHGKTPEELVGIRHAARRTARGIHPEDFEAYDAGIITGYKPDGSYQPGENWVEPEDEEDEEEPDDE